MRADLAEKLATSHTQEEGTGGVLQTRTWAVNPLGATGRPYLSATPTTREAEEEEEEDDLGSQPPRRELEGQFHRVYTLWTTTTVWTTGEHDARRKEEEEEEEEVKYQVKSKSPPAATARPPPAPLRVTASRTTRPRRASFLVSQR